MSHDSVLHSSIVYLEIDNRQCVQQSTECFQSATDVAAFLGALASSGNLNVPYIIEAVHSKFLSSSMLTVTNRVLLQHPRFAPLMSL